MEIEKAIKILEEFVKIDRSMRSEAEYFSDYDKFCEERCVAIETVLKEFERLKEENTDLKELYVRVTKNIKEKGNLELAEYMLAQIEATPTFTTWEDYKTWVSKDKIREYIKELNSKIFNADEIETVFIIKQIQILEELLKEE